jgi:hypothetical protein
VLPLLELANCSITSFAALADCACAQSMSFNEVSRPMEGLLLLLLLCCRSIVATRLARNFMKYCRFAAGSCQDPATTHCCV